MSNTDDPLFRLVYGLACENFGQKNPYDPEPPTNIVQPLTESEREELTSLRSEVKYLRQDVQRYYHAIKAAHDALYKALYEPNKE